MPAYIPSIDTEITERVGKMNPEDCLRQICCPHYLDPSSDMEAAGAVFFHRASRENLKAMVAKYHSLCSHPPLITTDMENGPGCMILDGTPFPMMSGCCLDENEEHLYELGKLTALEGGEVGFNSTLGPCVDIFDVHDSPAVGLRSPGPSADKVIRLAGQYMKGLQDHGMAATLKHFPGDGSCFYDQHLTVPENPMNMEQWWSGPGRVYKALVNEGACCVMPGHISLPAYDDIDPEKGMFPPATLSIKIMVDLLRKEVGFRGIIISDAVEMGGFAGYQNIYDAMARFWENGGDLLLFPKMDATFFREMTIRLEEGGLREVTLRNRAERVLAFKKDQGLFSSRPAEAFTPDMKSRIGALSRTMTKKAIVVKRDRGSRLPCSPQKTKKIAHLILEVAGGDSLSLLQEFTQALAQQYSEVVEWVDPGPNTTFSRLSEKEVDAVICSISSPYRYGTNVTRFHGTIARNMMKGWMNLGIPVIFVSHDSATFAEEYHHLDTVIATHGTTPVTLPLLVERITGEA